LIKKTKVFRFVKLGSIFVSIEIIREEKIVKEFKLSKALIKNFNS